MHFWTLSIQQSRAGLKLKFAPVRSRLRLVTGKRPNGTLEVEAKTRSGPLRFLLIPPRLLARECWMHEAWSHP